MERDLECNRALGDLFEVITGLKSREECARFFRDLCTMTELEAMAERWEVARLVHEGVTYRRIRELTGASTATITRVAHWVRHGEGGYRMVLGRRATEQTNKRAERANEQTNKRANEGDEGTGVGDGETRMENGE